jgi:hypothetical protein
LHLLSRVHAWHTFGAKRRLAMTFEADVLRVNAGRGARERAGGRTATAVRGGGHPHEGFFIFMNLC